MTTKKELEKEVFELEKQKRELLGNINKLREREKLAGLYMQCLRLLPNYIENNSGITGHDFYRILSILEQDSFPEGF